MSLPELGDEGAASRPMDTVEIAPDGTVSMSYGRR